MFGTWLYVVIGSLFAGLLLFRAHQAGWDKKFLNLLLDAVLFLAVGSLILADLFVSASRWIPHILLFTLALAAGAATYIYLGAHVFLTEGTVIPWGAEAPWTIVALCYVKSACVSAAVLLLPKFFSGGPQTGKIPHHEVIGALYGLNNRKQ